MGYYGYFILLADRFLKPGGRMALVLPAAILRVKSSRGIRKLFADRYNIEYLISGRGRLNFSEATWRREILLVAKKIEREIPKEATLLITLHRLPQNSSEVYDFYSKIDEARKLDVYENQNLSAISIPWEEMKTEFEDWFKYISVYEPKIRVLWNQIFKRAERSLVRFHNFLDREDIALKRGIESTRGMKVQAVFILKEIERARRKEDVWILKDVKKNYIVVTHRYDPSLQLRIPSRCVVPALRTVADNEFMDLRDKTDYVVTKKFPESDKFFFGKRAELLRVLPAWEPYVKDRTGNLIVLRRFVLPAPGTIHNCYYSPTPTAGPGMTWVVSNLKDSDAKILCLWFNSSLHLAQLLLNKIEDVWVDIHKYLLEDMFIPDPSKFSKTQRNLLISLFRVTSKIKFPNLKEEYERGAPHKAKIDKAILKALGFKEPEINRMLSELYGALKKELNTLYELMERS